MYNVIHESDDDILKGGDHLCIIHKRPPRRLSTYCVHYFHPKPFLGWSHIQDDTWMIKHLFLFCVCVPSFTWVLMMFEQKVHWSLSLPPSSVTIWCTFNCNTHHKNSLAVKESLTNTKCTMWNCSTRPTRTITKSTFLLSSKNREEIRLW